MLLKEGHEMDNKGAVTVFLVLITTVMLTFAGTLIDLSRIILAEYVVDSAAESATRSMMANYDTTLVGDYGLYAIEDTEENKNVFFEYLEKNINATDKNTSADDVVSLLKFTTASLDEENSFVEFSNPISDNTVFKDQLIDYHATRAVVIGVDELVNDIVDLIKDFGISKMLGKADDASSTLSNVESTTNSLNDTITATNKIPDNAMSLLSKATLKDFTESLGKLLSKQLTSKSVSAVFSITSNVISSTESWADLSGFSDSLDDIENEIALLESTLQTTESSLSGADYSYEGDSSISDTSTYINEGTDLDEITNRIATIRANIQTARTTIESSKAKFEKYAADEQIIKKATVLINIYVKGEIGDSKVEGFLITKDEVFDYLNQYISAAKWSSLKTKLTEIRDLVSNDEITEDDKYALSDLHDECYATMNECIKAVQDISIESMITYEQPSVKSVEEIYEEVEDEEEGSFGISDLQEMLDKFKTWFNTVTRNMQPYEIYGNSGQNVFDRSASVIVSDIFGVSAFKDLIGTIRDIADGNMTYKLILTSYIMDKTNYLTSSTRRSHYLTMGETEYILHNAPLEYQNVTLSVISVLKLRFVIDTLYYFIAESPPAVEGVTLLIKLTYSAGRGAIRALFDLGKMFILGQKIEFIPGAIGEAIEVSYRDHLTVALLLNGTSQETQERLINTINATIAYKASLNGESKSLTNFYTQTTTHTEVKCDLVFLNLMGFKDILGNVVEGKYTIKKDVVYSY